MRFPPDALVRGLGLIEAKLANAFGGLDPITGQPLLGAPVGEPPAPPPASEEQLIAEHAENPAAPLGPEAQTRRSSARVVPPKIVTTR